MASDKNSQPVSEREPAPAPEVQDKRSFLARWRKPERSAAAPVPASTPVQTVEAGLTQPGEEPSTDQSHSDNDSMRDGLPATQSLIGRALARTGAGIGALFLGRKAIEAELFEALETRLLLADVGVETCSEIIAALTDRARRGDLADGPALRRELGKVLLDILQPCARPLEITGAKPFVILVVGVNGVGKTTTIGKLARGLQRQGHRVMLAAGDTFRAAAVEQLQEWGERNAVNVVAQHTGADSASVIFDGVQSAQARSADVLIADTAGRLHTKDNLMEELKKIKRVLAKLDSHAPQEVLLVLDGGTGQNALAQMQQFNASVGVTGIVLTKLDGTAKGGVIFALCRRFGVPVRYLGVGEGIDDLQPFDARSFVDALLDSGVQS